MKNIREFLNKISVGYKSRSTFIKVSYGIENLKIIHFFYQKGWIKIYRIINNEIIIYLRYIKNKPLFIKVRYISTSGFRQYISKKSIPFLKKNITGHAHVLLNTSYGLLTLHIAEKLIIGGEVSYILYE